MKTPNEPVDRRPDNSAVVAFVVLICGVTVVELLIRLTLSFGSGHERNFVIKYAGWMLLPVFALASASTRSLGWRSLPVSLGCLATAYVMITRFRGMWVWSGTFDAYWLPQSTWLIPSLIGLAVGSLAGRFPARRSGFSDRAVIISLACLALAAAVEYAGGSAFTNSIDSVYAPTRAVAEIGLLVVLGTGVILKWREI